MILKKWGFQKPIIINRINKPDSIIFHLFKYETIHDNLFGVCRCFWMRNHAYHLKKKNSNTSMLRLNQSGASQNIHKLNGLIGRGQRKWISRNQKKVSKTIWVSIPKTNPLPTDFNEGLFFNSDQIAKRRYIKIRVKKLCEKVRWKICSAWWMG